ncbi:MAG TPA: hypothetical protein VMZ53_11410 [Kofleriaceae bacterium]|nr:hypothetical protein [Kofleriaceae bacterium]
MSDDTETCEIAKGPRAVRIVSSADEVEPELVAFVRSSARWIDPTFPQSGDRALGQKGQYTNDEGIECYFTQVEEYDSDGRGVRIVRYMRVLTPLGPHDTSMTVTAIGLANNASLAVRWDFITTEQNLRGKSAAIFISGARKDQCIADFREWFGATTS